MEMIKTRETLMSFVLKKYCFVKKIQKCTLYRFYNRQTKKKIKTKN